jgi:hypothetical protein
MLDFVQRFLGNFCLHLGLLLLGVALVVGGMKSYEHLTYVPTQATVVGLSVKCEMSYKVGRTTFNEGLIECDQVAQFKSRSPDTDWIVNRVTFVTVEYVIDGGLRVTATARSGKLELTNPRTGETVPILRSAENPTLITGPVTPLFMGGLGLSALAGIVLLGMWWIVRRWRARTQEAALRTLTPHYAPSIAPEDPVQRPSRVQLTPATQMAASAGQVGQRPARSVR